MALQKLLFLLRRSADGVRRRPWLHAISLLTLSAAFASFVATLTAARNLDALIDRWIGTAEMTVYAAEAATEDDIERLAKAIGQIRGIARVDITTPEQARDRFAADLGAVSEIARTLPEGAFPASLEIHLTDRISHDGEGRKRLAERIAKVPIVSEINLYDDWFERLTALSTMGRFASWGLGLLALIVAVLVVAAVVRAGLGARAREIQVMRIVGATERQVRLPFLIQGTAEAAGAMVVALFVLDALGAFIREGLEELLPMIGVADLVGLPASIATLLVAAAAVAGMMGSGLSIRALEGTRQ